MWPKKVSCKTLDIPHNLSYTDSMKFPETRSPGLNNTAVLGITLMTLHILGYLVGWWWMLLYILLIASGIGQEYIKRN